MTQVTMMVAKVMVEDLRPGTMTMEPEMYS